MGLHGSWLNVLSTNPVVLVSVASMGNGTYGVVRVVARGEMMHRIEGENHG